MKLWGLWSLAPLALAGVVNGGCKQAKSALASAIGIDELTSEEKDELLAKADWSEAKNPQLANFQIIGGFKLAASFNSFDLCETAEFAVPPGITIPEQAKGTAEKQRSLILMRAEDIAVDTATYTRFRIINLAYYSSADDKLHIDGKKVNEYIDAEQQACTSTGKHAGTYLLVSAKGDKDLAYLKGTIKLKKDGQTDAQATATKDAMVFTSTSPFVTVTGSSGTYLLAMLEGSKGTVMAYKKDIAKEATGTPSTASKEIAYAGVLTPYQGQFQDKVSQAGAGTDATAKANTLFDQANNAVTTFLNGWTLIESNLMFIQPKQQAPAQTPPAPTDPDKTPPTTPSAPEPAPAATSPVMRAPANDTTAKQFDLGCNGFDDAGSQIDMIRDGRYQDTYDAEHKGWRAMGDVRYAWDFAETIFGDPDTLRASATNYLDQVAGYCLLTTGNQMANTLGSEYTPGPNGEGKVSEMWQKVKVPAEAKSIQVRVAFFSQEFPQFVGTQFNDSFFIKFDESPDFIAAGNLNDLAGMADADKKAAVEACKSSLTTYTAGGSCGEWVFVKDKLTHGELWGIESSTSAPVKGDKWGCLEDATGSNKRCYHGMITPRIICKTLNDEDKNVERTLRINVSDAGDAYFDSALAVDSIVFSTKDCDDATGRMTPPATDPDSRVNQLME